MDYEEPIIQIDLTNDIANSRSTTPIDLSILSDSEDGSIQDVIKLKKNLLLYKKV